DEQRERADDERVGEGVPERGVVQEQPDIAQTDPPLTEDAAAGPEAPERDDVPEHRQVPEDQEEQQRQDRQRVQLPVPPQRPRPGPPTPARLAGRSGTG